MRGAVDGHAQIALGNHVLNATTERQVQIGETVTVVVRAEKIDLLPPGRAGCPARSPTSTISAPSRATRSRSSDGIKLLGLASLKDKPLSVGQEVELRIDPKHCRIL